MIKAVIIDDEPAVATIIRHFIKEESLPIEIAGTAENGVLGVSLIKKEEPEIVFLDIQMPMMNGFEVIRECPASNYIIVTAFEQFDYAQEALRLGAKDILLKPVEKEQLIKAIGRAVGWNFTGNEIVDGIMEYINEHYSEKIGLAALSEMFFVTPGHIARLFKKYVGESVVSYINRIRVEKSEVLLRDGVSVKDAAEKVGFESLNNYYKYFKMHTGETPANFVKRLK